MSLERRSTRHHAAPESSHPRRSRSWTRQVIAIAGLIVLAIVVIAALFLLPYLRGDSVVPFGFDTAHYIWRANVTIADGLDALRTFAPELNANAERPAFPVLASLIDAAGGPSPYLLAFVTPAVFATAVGLAGGAFAVDVLDEPPWAFAVFAIVVGGSLAVVRTAVGSLDALLVESVVLAGAAAAIVAATNRRAMAGAIVLLAAALVIHWVLAALFLVLLGCLAIALIPTSRRSIRDGSSLGTTPSARIGSVVVASVVTGLAALLAATPTFDLDAPRVTVEKVAGKVARRVPALRLWITGPAALLGAWALWFPRIPTRRWATFLLVGWSLTLALAIVAHSVLGATWLPAYRVGEFALAIPLLGASAVVALGAWSFRQGVAVSIAGAVVIVSILTISWQAGERSWAASRSLLEPQARREVIAAADFLHAARPSGPIIFVASKRGFTASDRAVRASLPGDLIASVHTFLGDSADLLAGEPINGFPNEDAELSWQRIAPLVDQDFTAIWLESLNPRSSPPEGSLSGAPGVWVVRGAPPPALATLAPLDVPTAGELIWGSCLTLGLLMIVGLGWATALVDVSWLARVGLSAAFGIAVLTLGGVVFAAVGWPLTGGGGRALIAVLAVAGWLLAGVVLRRDRHENASDDV